tara:strand:- start:1313 stop:2047 length:735 start_codon:yes stop_codon:yes gene_type:complete
MSLTFRRRGARVVRGRAGSFRALADGVRVVGNRLSDIGVVANSRESLVSLLSRQGVGGTAAEPMRIVLGEGAWSFYGSMTIERSNLHLIGMGSAKFVRTGADATPMLLFTGDNITIDGLWLEDTNSTDVIFEFQGDDCTVKDCWVEDCNKFVEVSGDRGRVSGNEIKNARATKSVHLSGTAELHVVSGNRFKTTAGEPIYADDNVSDSIFIGNVYANSTRLINYKGSSGNVGSASNNVGTVNVR